MKYTPKSTGLHRTRPQGRLCAAAAGAVLLLLLSAVFSGCARQPEEPALDFDPPESFSEAGAVEPQDRWWTGFDDKQLNSLVEKALEENFDLRTAWHRLREARALAERRSASLFPEIDAFSEAEARRSPGVRGDEEVFSLGMSADYEVDLWGRISSEVDAERYRADAGLEAYRTAAVSLSAEVAQTWYQLTEACSRLELLRDQAGANKKILSLVRARFANGRTGRADVFRQEQLFESTREQVHAAQSQISVLQHRLAVLLGRSPGRKTGCGSSNLPDPPPLPETGVPTELLSRRPDVREARLRLNAADMDLAAARISRYPRLSITASASTSDENTAELFQDWFRSIAANLAAPVLDGGRLRAEADAAEAVKNQRLYEYGQTVVEAFQEVEDALVQEEKQKDRVESLEKQLDLAKSAVRQLQSQYFNGEGSYIDVLNALTEQQQLQRDLLAGKQELIEYRIALYRALAGGFDTGRTAGDSRQVQH